MCFPGEEKRLAAGSNVGGFFFGGFVNFAFRIANAKLTPQDYQSVQTTDRDAWIKFKKW